MTKNRRAWRPLMLILAVLALGVAAVGCSDDDDSADPGGTGTETTAAEVAGLDVFASDEVRAPEDLPEPSTDLGEFSLADGPLATTDQLFNPDTAQISRAEGDQADPVEVNVGVSIVPASGWEEVNGGDGWVVLAPSDRLAWLLVAAQQVDGEIPSATDVVQWEMDNNITPAYTDVQQGDVNEIPADQLGEGIAGAATTVWQGTWSPEDGVEYSLESQVLAFVLNDGRIIILDAVVELGTFEQNIDDFNAMLGGLSAAPVDGETPDTTEPTETTDTTDTTDGTETPTTTEGGIGILPPPSGEGEG